jgi:15-cis-phytoene synthase
MVSQETQRGGGETVRAAARQLDRDRYLAALLAPQRARDGLMALAAFHGEIARIPLTVHEPAIGDIRLQWWRDALITSAGTATGNPVADAMRRTMREHALTGEMLIEIVDAYARMLEAGTMTTTEAIDAHVEAAQGAAFQAAAQILGSAATAPVAALLAAAAQSYGRVQLLRTLPLLVSKGRNPFGDADVAASAQPLLKHARVELARARQLATAAPATILPAILPLALVEPYLAALEGVGSHVADQRADISPLTRVWRLLKASTLGRV